MKKKSGWYGANVSYKVKLTLVLLVYLAVPFLVIGISLTAISVTRLNATVEKKLEETAESYQKRFELKRNEIVDKMNFLAGYSRLNDLLRVEKRVELMQMLDWDREVNEVLDSMVSFNGQSEIMVYCSNENLYDTKYVRKLAQDHAEKYEQMLEGNSIKWELCERNGDPYLNGVRKYSLGKQGNVILDIVMPMEETFGLSALEENNSFTVYVRGGEVIPVYLTEEEQLLLVRQYLEKGKLSSYKIREYRIPDLDGTFYTIMDTHNTRKILAAILAGCIFLFGLLGIGVIVIVRLTVNRLTHRLTQIVSDVTCDHIKAAEKKENDQEEFNIIQNKLYELVCGLREQNDRMLKMELENLSSKLSPHFLYNNLSSIKYKSNSEEMNQVVDCLVSYYRYMFRNNLSFCELGREADNLKVYARLLAFSYEEDFEFACSVLPELAETLIPSNILQPLVENAFLYGVNNKGGNKHIGFKAYTQDNKLVIEVNDDGGGTFVEKPKKESSTVLINRRLKLYYGEEYGLFYEKRNGWTVARIIVPDSSCV